MAILHDVDVAAAHIAGPFWSFDKPCVVINNVPLKEECLQKNLSGKAWYHSVCFLEEI